MRSGLRTASASRTKIQNVCSGFTLVSQSVSCCHAGKCSLVFSKDLLTKYIAGLSLDILKMESWTHMGRTANIIIKDVIHVFASFSKIMLILLMGRRNRERCIVFCASNLSGYLTHVVEWTGAIWPSCSFRSAVVVPMILLAEKLDSCRMNRGEYLLTLTLCPVQ